MRSCRPYVPRHFMLSRPFTLYDPLSFGELKQKAFPVAAVGDVPDMIWQKIPLRTGHRAGSLKRSLQKTI